MIVVSKSAISALQPQLRRDPNPRQRTRALTRSDIRKSNTTMPIHYRKIAVIYLRAALGLSFLSAVGDRFGLWGTAGTHNVSWGNFSAFLHYTQMLLWFLPGAFIKPMGWLTTICEFSLGIGLLIGFRLRWFALASSLLLLRSRLV
jgi:uncharacterized membrane protein YphA (DoxX/SURF4 family)